MRAVWGAQRRMTSASRLPSDLAVRPSADYDFADYDFADYDNWSLENWREASGHDDDGGGVSEWCEAGRREAAVKAFQACLFSVVFLLGVAGNGLVVATLAARRRRGPRSPTDAFLLQLALADLLPLLTLPLQAVDAHAGWIFSAPACRVTRAVYAVNMYGGPLILACIGADRYLAVAARRPRARRTFGRAATAAAWSAALLLGLPELLFSGVWGSGPEAHCGTLARTAVKRAADGAALAVFALSFLSMAACYSAIAGVLRAGGVRRRRRRTLKLMAALVLLFALFQLPHSALTSLKMAGPLCAPLPERVTRSLAYVRCCLDPLAYALAGGRFRRDALELLRPSRPSPSPSPSR
ncbi:C-C chemokine receptor type 10-like [Stigmatopora argus]